MTDERNKEFEFKVGDKVKIPESSQVHTLQASIGDRYPLVVRYRNTKDNLVYVSFTLQGRRVGSHELPVLTLVERPRKYKEVTKIYTGNLYGYALSVYSTVEEALRFQDAYHILNPHNKIVKVTYMVEDLDN